MKNNYVFKNNKTMFSIDLTLSYEKIRTFLNKFYIKSLITIKEIAEIYRDICCNYNYFDSDNMFEKSFNLSIKYLHNEPKKIKVIY